MNPLRIHPSKGDFHIKGHIKEQLKQMERHVNELYHHQEDGSLKDTIKSKIVRELARTGAQIVITFEMQGIKVPAFSLCENTGVLAEVLVQALPRQFLSEERFGFGSPLLILLGTKVPCDGDFWDAFWHTYDLESRLLKSDKDSRIEVRVDDCQKAWIAANGGSHKIRELVAEAMAKERKPRSYWKTKSGDPPKRSKREITKHT